MRIISESIGYDGSSFFCRRCGKAGYSKMAQVRGHLAMCPGRAISKGAIPQPVSQPVATSYNPVTAAPIGGLQIPLTASRQQQPQPVPDSYTQLDNRVKQLENEYNHLLVERNRPADDWFSRNKNTVMLIAILAFGFFVMMQNSQSCNGDNSGKSSKSPFSSLGEKALSQFVSRGVSKGVDSLFGK